ncbi:hypothetical protein AB0903_08320 [Streptomyces sp. NPDC048389]|uniref:hypothetical protein n=1 Tax=Streptomyces sp. NPDC048389 TaxID=3154622 RepID=UPI003453E838
MDSDTRPPGAAEAGQFCHFHGGESGTALPVKSVARNSGPDVLLHACAPCREQRHLVPLPAAS